tara:strand:- start:445 stop:4596 length:4152 start_codon:yes stop_codon:yes gene_type:complete
MLNVPQAFLNGYTGNTSSVYPIVVITAGDNIIRLSQIKGVFDGEYYEDRFLKVNSINEKIDIQEKKFQVNQVRVQVSNYIINQIRFTEKFKNFSFTNAKVDIYYANKACKTLDDCLFIFKGFVKSYEGNKETVSFSIEDHSQYTLDQKSFPKYSTVDPQAESVAESKDVYYPVVYGHVDKSPMIFSKASNGTVFSQIYPEAILFDIKIGGIARTDNPLLMFRDDMYLPVPEIFRPLPDIGGEGFLINGFDYTRYNNTSQYTIPEEGERNYIQLEKKSSDVIGSNYLLPSNVAARDQFQVDASREVTSINADTSADTGDEDGYLVYGGEKEIRYIGRADGYDPYGENNHWLFPLPTGQIKLGYYQDLILGGIVMKYFDAEFIYSSSDTLYGNSSHACLVYYMDNSTMTANDTKGFDMLYLPMPQGEGQTELIQYFNEEYISENDIVEINWSVKNDSVPLWDASYYARHSRRSSNLDGFPNDDFFDYSGISYGANLSDQNWYQYLYGVDLINSNGDIVDTIALDRDFTSTEIDLKDIIKPNVYAWINLDSTPDTWSNTEGNLIPDGVVNLRKLLWGRKVTRAESDYANINSENSRPIQMGSSIYGLYPCLGYNVPKSSIVTGGFQTYPTGQGTMKYKHYELSVDSLFSYKNPYLLNPENPIGDNNWESLLVNLQKFDYSTLDTPEEQNRLVLAKHDSEKSYVTNNDNAGVIAFYGNQTPEFASYALAEDSQIWQDNNISDRHHGYQLSNIVTSGIEAVNGGNWVPINNIQGKKDVVKLDLSFQSLSGDDIILGGVYSKIRGKITVDAWKSPNADTNFTGGTPALRVECDALWRTDDIVIKVDQDHFTNGVFGMPDTATDADGNPSLSYTFVTGDPENDGHTNPDDIGTSKGGITFDSDVEEDGDPLFLNTDCSATRYDDDGDLVDDDQWRENINAVNTISLLYHIDEQDLTDGVEDPIETSTTLFFKTKIDNLTLNQRYIVGNAHRQKYFADVIGRIDEQDGRYTGIPSDEDNYELIKKPSDILMHIIEKELDYTNEDAFDQESVEEARTNHAGWRFDFSVAEKTEAKNFIEDFAKSTKLIPRFRHNGTFGFINIYQNYNQADTMIRSTDVSDFKYSKTPIEDVALMVRVKYMYDYGTEKYTEATNFSNDGAVPKNVEDMQEMYAINSLTDAYLEVESKYIRNSNTALLLRNYLLEWYKNQHNIIDCTLPPKYMYLECGDVVEFDSLIEEMSIFGDDYTEEYSIGEGVNAQKALPYFIVEEIKKSQKNVKVKLLQLHKSNIADIQENSPNYLTGNFYTPVEEISEEDVIEGEELEEIILGDANQDGQVDISDIVTLIDIVISDIALENLNTSVATASDFNQDGQIDLLDIISIAQSIINSGDTQV